MDYWEECIREAFEDAKIEATQEQIDIVAGWVQGAHENHGMAYGYNTYPNRHELENDRLKIELAKEKAKTVCPECKGKGYLTENYLNRSSTSDCFKCRGEGKI